MESFVSQRTRVVVGPGSVGRLGELAAELGLRRVFLVSDPSIAGTGHTARGEESLRAVGIEVVRYVNTPANPAASDVAKCRAELGDWPADGLVALGGGSAIDLAKGCAFVLAGGGTMEDYWGKGTAKGTLLPLIAVPTTAGTGSEVQSFALIEQDGTHQKMACGDEQAAPRVAILDPELTVTMPRAVTVATGLDALTHAVETMVTSAATESSRTMARRAFGLIAGNFERVLSHPTDLEARAAMLEGAALAGAAIEGSMLGAAHAMGNPLTAHLQVTHGVAVATALPAVVRFNGEDADIAHLYGLLATDNRIPGEGAEAIAAEVERLLDVAGLPRSLHPHGVRPAGIPELAEEAARQWTAQFNPRPVGAAEFARLYGAISEAIDG